MAHTVFSPGYFFKRWFVKVSVNIHPFQLAPTSEIWCRKSCEKTAKKEGKERKKRPLSFIRFYSRWHRDADVCYSNTGHNVINPRTLILLPSYFLKSAALFFPPHTHTQRATMVHRGYFAFCRTDNKSVGAVGYIYKFLIAINLD